jgi:hypothetical protein
VAMTTAAMKSVVGQCIGGLGTAKT